jgi:hypothetical protein
VVELVLQPVLRLGQLVLVVLKEVVVEQVQQPQPLQGAPLVGNVPARAVLQTERGADR